MIKEILQRAIDIITKNDYGKFKILTIKVTNFDGMYEYLDQHNVKECGARDLSWTAVIRIALCRENINFKFVNNY